MNKLNFDVEKWVMPMDPRGDYRKTYDKLPNDFGGLWIAVYKHTESSDNRSIAYPTYICPDCGKSNGRNPSNYCPNCGVRLLKPE